MAVAVVAAAGSLCSRCSRRNQHSSVVEVAAVAVATLREAEVVAEVEEDLVAEAVRWQAATAAAAASSAVVAPSVVVEAADSSRMPVVEAPLSISEAADSSRTPAVATITAGLHLTMPVRLSSSLRRRPLERAPQQTAERIYLILNGSTILFRRSVRGRRRAAITEVCMTLRIRPTTLWSTIGIGRLRISWIRLSQSTIVTANRILRVVPSVLSKR